MDNDVIYMTYKNKTTEIDDKLLACKRCRNKTFLLIPCPEMFPMMTCCACSLEIGRIGWIPSNKNEK